MADAAPVPLPPITPSEQLEGVASSSAPSFFERISTWASRNKATVYTIAGITLVATAAGIYYYSDAQGLSSSENSAARRKSKKERRKGKKDAGEASRSDFGNKEGRASVASVESEDELPEVDDTVVAGLSEQDRKDYAAKYKAAGNNAYGSKDYNKAIELYSKALLCKQDPIFYSNRAACWNAMSNWDKVIEDTTAAINLDSEYVKALNRRANAYQQTEKYSEALLDFTASCIIDGFRTDASAQSVEKLLKKVAEAKAKKILASKEKRLPSSIFITNYLQSYRPKPLPKGLEEDIELTDDSGKGQLRRGLLAMKKKSSDGYAEAAAAFDKALELGDLGDNEALALNLRGTFRYLRNETDDALADLTKSIELQPSFTQSYIKRASIHMESGNREEASKDFERAIEMNKDDPDIYYYRAQLHFILSEFAEAAKDYQKSIDLDKDFIFSHIQLGVTQYKMGSIASSTATFRRCMKNFDRVPDVYNYYGELLLDQQKYQEAVDKFDTAVDMEKATKPMGMNVLPLINKALALFQWKQDYGEAEGLCQKALSIDPECDIAVVTMAQLLLQQGKVTEALKYFERAAELSRTEGEITNALEYAEATRTQLEVQQKYPQLASRLQGMGAGLGGPGMR